MLKEGIAVDAVIRQVVAQRFNRTSMDMLTLEYPDAATGHIYPAKATTLPGKYRAGDTMPLWYLSNDPSKYALDNGKGYWGVLIFCILLLAFTIFASIKINEMVRSGNYY
jgi:hypothetical protein